MSHPYDEDSGFPSGVVLSAGCLLFHNGVWHPVAATRIVANATTEVFGGLLDNGRLRTDAVSDQFAALVRERGPRFQHRHGYEQHRKRNFQYRDGRRQCGNWNGEHCNWQLEFCSSELYNSNRFRCDSQRRRRNGKRLH